MVRIWLSVNLKRHGVDCWRTVGRIGPRTRAERSRKWPHLGHNLDTGKTQLLRQLPGHSPVHLSNKRAPRRSITVLTTEKIAPWMAAASKISLNGYSVSSGFGGSGLSPGAAHFQTYLKMVPAMSPPMREPASPIGR